MKSLVIIPTYNEHENIRKIIEAVFRLGLDLGILVVDDNSPDGTGALVEALAAQDRRITVLHREKKTGLGQAYIAGFKKALTMDVQFIFEMDADFSHNPERIPQFLDAIQNSDMVIGSRYVGGRVNVVNWPIRRLILSYCANLYTRVVTGMPIADATGGFKCFRREVLAGLDLDRISSDGYSFQIEMNFTCWKKGFRITEVPIIFTDRFHGQSKMSKHILWEAMWMVWKLRLLSLCGRI